MNENLIIPEAIQTIINNIENTDLYLVELPLEQHPKLPNFNRFIRVNDIDVKSKNEFVVFGYQQILKEKETGKIVNITLPTPEWIVYKDTWSYLRNEENKPIIAKIKENTSETDDKIKVPSYKYMIWMMKNNKSSFLQLIQGYLLNFIETKKIELDQL